MGRTRLTKFPANACSAGKAASAGNAMVNKDIIYSQYFCLLLSYFAALQYKYKEVIKPIYILHISYTLHEYQRLIGQSVLMCFMS
jgi:hypothetical protein